MTWKHSNNGTKKSHEIVENYLRKIKENALILKHKIIFHLIQMWKKKLNPDKKMMTIEENKFFIGSYLIYY